MSTPQAISIVSMSEDQTREVMFLYKENNLTVTIKFHIPAYLITLSHSLTMQPLHKTCLYTPPFKILLKYNGLQLTYRVVNSGNQNRYKQYYFNTSNSHCVCPEKLISCDIPSFTYQTLDHKSTWENSSSVKLLYCSKACEFPLWLLS